jgi:hypothetical protein
MRPTENTQRNQTRVCHKFGGKEIS